MKKYVDGEYLDLTPEEEAEALAAGQAAELDELQRPRTTEELVAELIRQNEMLTECVLEMSEMLYN